MLTTDDVEYLQDRRDILTQMQTIKDERDNKVRELLANGASVLEIIGPSGLTRARIYQIKGNTR